MQRLREVKASAIRNNIHAMLRPPKAQRKVSNNKDGSVAAPVVVNGRDWNDGFAAINSEIPNYQVTQDKHTQSYIAGLQRNKRLSKYL